MTSSLAIEVAFQDAFFSSASFKDGELPAPSQCPITPETWTSWFQSWIEALYPDIPRSEVYELSLRLTDDREIQALNAQYRHQDEPTDVLAFAALEVDVPQPLDELAALEPLYLGDIIISVETATRQAQQQGHPLKIELAWLASHGLLHLLAWDHPDNKSLLKMLAQQAFLLNLVGLETPGR